MKVLLADPPWPYSNWGAPAGEIHQRTRGSSKHYPAMTIEQIAGLPVQELRCQVLFMWTTWNHIMYAPYVMKSWGFDYKTLAWVWVKTLKWEFPPIQFTQNLEHVVSTGMGYYTRHCTEPCLVGLSGLAPVAVRNIKGIIFAPRKGHSSKPDEQYTKIESLYPGSEYYELFARKQWPGWKVWGDSIPNTFELRRIETC